MRKRKLERIGKGRPGRKGKSTRMRPRGLDVTKQKRRRTQRSRKECGAIRKKSRLRRRRKWRKRSLVSSDLTATHVK